MKTVGIIAEYNPFHKGHAYQLQEAKKLTGADYVIVVMSGSFVQRGLPALTDKYTRTEMALKGGADLVLELPGPYATGSAEDFAQGAVSLLDSLRCIDAVCFGSECGDLNCLFDYARLFEEEPEGYRQLFHSYLKKGFSFPAARSHAAEEYLNYTARILPCASSDSDCRYESEILLHPNNILGIEYCRALLRRKSHMVPVTLRRTSCGYHDLSMEGKLASATAIRNCILEEGLSEAVSRQLPADSFEILTRAYETRQLVTSEDFTSILFYRLLSMSREELADIQDVPLVLASRIKNCLFSYSSPSTFADELKSKQFTHTRITRALCHILLDLRQDNLDLLRNTGYPSYLRALGFRKSATPLLTAIKEKSAWPLLVKTADASKLLNPMSCSLFEKDVYATHIYEAVKVQHSNAPFITEYMRSPIILI